MVTIEKMLSPQEERMMQGHLVSPNSRLANTRVGKMLEGFREKPPKIDVDRARLFTQSSKETEGLPIELRWAKAMQRILEQITVAIGEHDLIVGRYGGLEWERYGFLYPEFRAGWFAEGVKELPNQKAGMFGVTDSDIRIVNDEIAPYWKGKTVHDAYVSLLPQETRNFFFKEDVNQAKAAVYDLSSAKSTMNWISDLTKVLNKGFDTIKREAEERLASLDPFSYENGIDKMPFLKSVIIVSDAMITFAGRYARLARDMALTETNEERKKELLEISGICSDVPAKPAKSFREAMQALWLTRVALCFEQEAGGEGLGRLDQYLYPYYERDIKEGRLKKEEALDMLNHLWLNMARYVRLSQTGIIGFWEGYSHFEQTTIGGQTKTGHDATNDLSYLILESRREFPLEQPDLMARIHSRTPQQFLIKVCECIKEGQGFPKLMNDEEIIPLLVAKGASFEEAIDYCGSGCTEVRLPNRDTYSSLGVQASLAAALEMALNNGIMRLSGEKLGVTTGDPRDFRTFEDVMNAFQLQLGNFFKHCFVKQTILDMVRPARMAAPLHSCLHSLCIDQCLDIHSGKIKNGLILGNFHMVGFGTVIDSLASLKKLVYEEKTLTMAEMLQALETNFEGKETLRQLCLNAPKYGNNNTYADSIGNSIEGMLISFVRRYTNLPGGEHDLSFVPITSHGPLGAAVGALPNGRKAKEPLSEGIGPTQGADIKGPTATLLSLANTRNAQYKERQARLFNLKFSPQTVAGYEGTAALASLVRTWCDLKLWHVQFNIINTNTLRDAQKHPEKYRNLLVRVAGYSAYFVDLSPAMQEDIIRRTEHQSVG